MVRKIHIAIVAIIIIIAAVIAAAGFTRPGVGLPYCPSFSDEQIKAEATKSLSLAFRSIEIESIEQTYCDSGIARYQAIARADGNRIIVHLAGNSTGLSVPLGR